MTKLERIFAFIGIICLLFSPAFPLAIILLICLGMCGNSKR